MRCRDLLAHLRQAAGQRRFNHHRADAGLGDKFKIVLSQAFIPGDGYPRFAGKRARIVAGFAGFFEKGNAAAVRRVDVLCKLLRLERRPGAVSVQTQMKVGDRLQQKVSDHSVAHRFVETDFNFRHFLARHGGEQREQLVRIARAERCRAVVSLFRQATVQLRQRAADAKSCRRHVRQRRIRALTPRVSPRQQC